MNRFTLFILLCVIIGLSTLQNLFAIDVVIDNTATPIDEAVFYRYGGYVDIPPMLPQDFLIGELQESFPREVSVQKILKELHTILPTFRSSSESLETTLAPYLFDENRSLVLWHVMRHLELFQSPVFRIGRIILVSDRDWEVPVRFIFANDAHVIFTFLFYLEGSQVWIKDIYGDSLPTPYEKNQFSPPRMLAPLGS